MSVLDEYNIKASFFLTGDFYRNPKFESLIRKAKKKGHYLGAHSDKHLLYCSWDKRDSLLVTREIFEKDLKDNYLEMKNFGVTMQEAPFYLPPYEWYNDSISQWSADLGIQLINFTHGTLSHADYTLPTESNYRTSQQIMESILSYESNNLSGLNGFILLSHIGVHKNRADKFYLYIEKLIQTLQERGYIFQRVDLLLSD